MPGSYPYCPNCGAADEAWPRPPLGGGAVWLDDSCADHVDPFQ
jgi:hypothetical protein